MGVPESAEEESREGQRDALTALRGLSDSACSSSCVLCTCLGEAMGLDSFAGCMDCDVGVLWGDRNGVRRATTRCHDSREFNSIGRALGRVMILGRSYH